jgi:hypothetical protein
MTRRRSVMTGFMFGKGFVVREDVRSLVSFRGADFFVSSRQHASWKTTSNFRFWPTVTRTGDWWSLLRRGYPFRAKSANVFFSDLLDRFHIA